MRKRFCSARCEDSEGVDSLDWEDEWYFSISHVGKLPGG